MTTSTNNRGLLGKPVDQKFLDETLAQTSTLKDKGWPAKLVSILIGDIPAVSLYLRNQIEEGGKHITVGDVDFVSCSELAVRITPPPGGVGSVTVAAVR